MYIKTKRDIGEQEKIETNEEAKTTNSDLEELRKFFNPEKED